MPELLGGEEELGEDNPDEGWEECACERDASEEREDPKIVNDIDDEDHEECILQLHLFVPGLACDDQEDDNDDAADDGGEDQLDAQGEPVLGGSNPQDRVMKGHMSIW